MYSYAVIGAGRQGIAAVYDLAVFGDAKKIILFDINENLAISQAEKINKLLKKKLIIADMIDISKKVQLKEKLLNIDTVISAVHYKYNLNLTKIAISLGVNMVDLGGNTEIVKKQIEYSDKAEKKHISIIPDCGMGPGMNISLAVFAMELMDKPEKIKIYDGGLPQKPEPPWNYISTFNIEGLINEYYSYANFIRDGEVKEIPALSEYEIVDFKKPIGVLEAFVTSGGLSTAPWSFQNNLITLENKTLRYLGHWVQFSAFSDLGMFETGPVKFKKYKLNPREFLSEILKKKIYKEKVKDIGIIKVYCSGLKNEKKTIVNVSLIDYYDENTNFTAMQRLTGWHASIVAILATKNRINKGVIPIEKAVSGRIIVNEAKKRGFKININYNFGE